MARSPSCIRRLCAAAAFLAFHAATASAQNAEEKLNMALAGYHDLAGRSAYQPTLHSQSGRWIAYVGHHGGSAVNPLNGRKEDNGTSILDVTDPRQPKLLAHLPGEPGAGETGGAQMVRVCTGLPKAPGRTFMLRTYGNAAQEVWDTTDPAKPVQVSTVVSGLYGTHKNWWECDTGIAYLISGAPGWRSPRMTLIYDLSDPSKPKFIRHFGLPGQQPGATGPVPTALHGPISTGPKGNRVYFGYGTNSGGVVQIVDREKLLNGPKEPTPQNLLAPQIARLDLPTNTGAHTVFPLLGVTLPEFAKDREGAKRDFILVVNEAIQNECLEARQMVWVLDITKETAPFGVANWTVPEASGNFCGRGGRFGAHSSNESFAPVYYKKLAFIAFFNAGVRALDLRDPMNPKEAGYYIPATTAATDKRCVKENCKIAIQTNNVETDDRGYIYIVDRANTGMHILELTGAARAIAGLP